MILPRWGANDDGRSMFRKCLFGTPTMKVGLCLDDFCLSGAQTMMVCLCLSGFCLRAARAIAIGSLWCACAGVSVRLIL